jgi:hypothetical protein
MTRLLFSSRHRYDIIDLVGFFLISPYLTFPLGV